MSETKFSVMQSTLEVVSDLVLAPTLRRVKGDQFTMSLKATNSQGVFIAPLDIHVTRLPEGEGPEADVDGSMVAKTTACIDPEGEVFRISIRFERAKEGRDPRPTVRVADRMFDLLRASLESSERAEVEAFLRDSGHA